MGYQPSSLEMLRVAKIEIVEEQKTKVTLKVSSNIYDLSNHVYPPYNTEHCNEDSISHCKWNDNENMRKKGEEIW